MKLSAEAVVGESRFRIAVEAVRIGTRLVIQPRSLILFVADLRHAESATKEVPKDQRVLIS